MLAMRGRCALLGIRDPAIQCKLLGTLVLPILRHGCEVWGVNSVVVKSNIDEAAEVLSRVSLKQLLGGKCPQQMQLCLQSG